MSGTRRMVILGFLLLAGLTAARADEMGQEAMNCANDNTPVCARSQSEYLLFKNECDFRKAQRENLMPGPLFDVSLQNCVPSCDFECNDGFHPICGFSAASRERRTFRNRCEMARTACSSKSEWLLHNRGVCPRSKQAAHNSVRGMQRKRRQPVPCTNVYRPVCASYAGVKSTFSNECLVNSENIRTGRNWRVVSEGLCGEDSIKMKHSRKFKPKQKPKVDMERSKRSHKQLNQLDDFEISEDAVQIFAPSTFHTQFISNSGTMEKSYSLPARKPHGWNDDVLKQSQLKSQSLSQSWEPSVTKKPCVFSNEPVCGSFKGETRTFPNVCALMEYSQAVGNAWSILYDGTCRQCDKPCPTVYSPICANRNGIDYTIINECYLERVRCKDPNSDWKITHKGECTHGKGDKSQNISITNQKPMSSIPAMLYSAYTMSPPSLTTPKPTIRTRFAAVSSPRRKYRKLRRTTTKEPERDLSNRKIRKIELATFDKNNANMANWHLQPNKLSTASKLWASKDNWLMHQNLENVRDKFNKKPKKYTHYSWPTTTAAPIELLSATAAVTTAATTTTTAATETTAATTTAATATATASSATPLKGVTEQSTQQNIPETESESENLFKVDTTSLAEGISTKEETTTRSTTSVEITATPTAATSALSETSAPTTKDETTTRLSSTIRPEDSTIISSTILYEGTTEEIHPSTVMAVEMETVKTTAETATSDVSTMPNLDYMSDEAQLNQGDQTSIYGLDKNSLIMRLLRARSSKSMVL